MPPKRKRAPPAPASEPGSPPSRASSELREEEEEEQEEEEQPDAPEASSLFYNTTFSAYRVSPLHVGRETLDAAAFQTLSKRLRDTLVGDVVRGVQVGLASDDGTLGRAGALDGVAWRWVALADLLGIDGDGDDNDDDGRGVRDGSADLGARDDDTDEEGTTTAGRGRRKDEEKARRKNTAAQALAVELQYENAAFSALLLPDFFAAPPAGQDGGGGGGSTWTSHSSIPAPPPPKPDDTAAPGRQFHHLPLLLLRMPVPLKSVMIEFLCRTFDARIAPLRLGTRTLVSSWERWLALSGARAVRRLNKDVALTLGFHLEPPPPDDDDGGRGGGGGDGGGAPAPEPAAKKAGKPTARQPLGLRSLDLIIPAPDVHRFLRAGTTADPGATAEASATDDDRGGGPLSPSRRRQLAGGLDDEGWGWRTTTGATLDSSSPPSPSPPLSHPFTEALRAYLDGHLALDLFHPGVRVLRIACDGFSLAEGRVKLFRPASPAAADAAWHLVGHLVDKARGRTDWMAVSFS